MSCKSEKNGVANGIEVLIRATHERHTSKRGACIYDISDSYVAKITLQKTYVTLAKKIRRKIYVICYNYRSETLQLIVYIVNSLMLRDRRKGTYLKKLVISITDRAKISPKFVSKLNVNKMAESQDIRGKCITKICPVK
jgi:hypothetical protein